MDVDSVVAALRHPPRHAALLAILDLSLHRGSVGLVEQGIFVRRHYQQWHEVFEHRAAPRQQHRLSACGGEKTTEREPGFLWQRALRNGDEVAQSRFGCQEVVVARIRAALADVVSNHQLPANLVEQEFIVGRGEGGCLQCKRFDGANSFHSALCTLRDQRLRCVKRRQFAECRNTAGARNVKACC